jgi:hypothetical protein
VCGVQRCQSLFIRLANLLELLGYVYAPYPKSTSATLSAELGTESERERAERQRCNLPKLRHLRLQLLFPRAARSAGVVSSAGPVDPE